jgi:hypothetical protein
LNGTDSWKEKALRQSIERIVDCVKDFKKERVTEEDYTSGYGFLSELVEVTERGTLVSYPGRLERVSKSVGRLRIDEVLETIREKELEKSFIEIAEEAKGSNIVNFKLTRFVNNLLKPEADFDHISEMMIDEILERPVTWQIRAFLFGLVVDEPSLEMKYLTIRNPLRSDFIPDFIDWRRYDQPENVPDTNRWEPVHVVAEWKESGIPKSRHAETKLIRCVKRNIHELRLCKSSKFLLTKWIATNDFVGIDEFSFDEIYRHSIDEGRYPSPTIFGEREQKKYNLLVDPILRREDLERNLRERVNRAMGMYDLACARDGVESILFSVIGLETLYSDGGSELKYKLASRTTGFLSRLWGESSIIFQNMTDAYDLRSRYVHGLSLKTSKEEISEVESIMLEYLRCSIISWLGGAYKSENAQTLRNTLDRAPFDEKASNRIDDFVKGVIF